MASGLYANFPRRLNALSVDAIVLAAYSAILFMLMSGVRELPIIHVALGALWGGGILLYEPLLVWRTGGTVGHRAMNLQVVADRTGGHPSLIQALARFLIKGFLGALSFLTMNFNKRHQALHDLLTESSVRIRDASKAQPHEYTVGPA
jgi:uncharacterized RDD family membrane protein YckC